MKRSVNFWKGFFPVLLLITTLSCSRNLDKVKDDKPVPGENEIVVTRVQFESGNMQLGKVSLRPFSERVRASGVIDVPPQSRAKISAIMGGFVREIPLLIGNEVKKGQLLVVLENPDFIQLQQEYLEISEQLDYLKTDFERQEKLFNEKIASEKNYLKARSEYNRSVATHSGLTSKLQILGIDPDNVLKGSITSRVVIRSPVNGTVTKVNVSLGSYVNSSDIIMEVVNPEHKHLEMNVFEKDILKLKIGQTIRFRVPETSSEIYKANIVLIGKSVDQETRTVNVHGHLDEEDEERFTVGMFVESEIMQDQSSLPALPESAILGTGAENFILTVKENHKKHFVFKRIYIRTGVLQDGYVLLENFHDSTAQILVRGGFSVADQSE